MAYVCSTVCIHIHTSDFELIVLCAGLAGCAQPLTHTHTHTHHTHTHTQELKCFLPTGPDPPALDPEAKEVDIIESEGTRGVGGAQGGGAIYDEDGENKGVGGAQRVGCSQQ